MPLCDVLDEALRPRPVLRVADSFRAKFSEPGRFSDAADGAHAFELCARQRTTSDLRARNEAPRGKLTAAPASLTPSQNLFPSPICTRREAASCGSTRMRYCMLTRDDDRTYVSNARIELNTTASDLL